MAQVHLAQDVQCALFAFGFGHPEVFQLQFDVLFYGELLDQIEALEHKSDASLAVLGSVFFLDQTDPIQVVISSTTGDKIVNGTGSTTLRADLWQAGSEIDKEGNTFNYTWYKYDKTGTPDEDWNTTGSKSGKSIEVQAADIDVKSTFVCEITKK